MKLLGINKSKRGHCKKDFIFSVTDTELQVLKLLVIKPNSTFELGDKKEKLKNAHNGITRIIANLK